MTTVTTKYIMPGKVIFVDYYTDLPNIGLKDMLYIVRYDIHDKRINQMYEYKDNQYVELASGIDMTAIENKIKESVEEHEKKTVYKDKVHGLAIDGEVLQYWDEEKEEWVDLYASEFQTLPRIKNLKAENIDGNKIKITFENPTTANYVKTELYISETDITQENRDFIIANSTLLVNDNITTEVEYSVTNNKIYYIVGIAVHDVDSNVLYSTNRSISILTKDTMPPGTVTDLTISPRNEGLLVRWKNPLDVDFNKVIGIYKKDTAPTNIEDGTIFVNSNAEESIIDGLENGQLYYVRLYTLDVTGNINDDESMIASGTPNDVPDTGPGPQNLIAGDANYGFYGEVSASELWTGTELSLLLGITQGTIQFDDTPWLKWAHEGKILFRPKKAFRHSISWDHLDSKGIIYGNKKIKHNNGYEFSVRLIKGALTDPSKNEADRGAKYSEWNRIMLPIHIQAKDQSWSEPGFVESDIPYWGIDYTDSDLQLAIGNNGGYHWCQEKTARDLNQRVVRGHGVSGSSFTIRGSATATRGYAPVLELIQE